MKYIACFLLLAAQTSVGLNFGANVHDNRQGSTYVYNKYPIANQLSLMTSSNLFALRTDCTTSACAPVIPATASSNVMLLIEFDMYPSTSLTEAQNYSAAYAAAVAFAKQFPTVQYFEVGNELDNWTGISGDGSQRSQYNASKYVQARGLINGAIAGFKAQSPNSKTLVDDAGWCHYGFKQALWADGVRWDITAVHWYASQGDIQKAGCNNANVAQIQYSSFGVPVWITEFNSDTAAANADANAEAIWLSQFIAEISQVAVKYNMQAAFIYELFDESNLSGAQAHFGIADSTALMKPPIVPVLKTLPASGNTQVSPPSHLTVVLNGVMAAIRHLVSLVSP